MIIRTIGFNPLKVTVDNQESPVEKINYKDEDGVDMTLFYISVNGQKFPIEYRSNLLGELRNSNVDQVLEKVEVKRLEKIEADKKDKNP